MTDQRPERITRLAQCPLSRREHSWYVLRLYKPRTRSGVPRLSRCSPLPPARRGRCRRPPRHRGGVSLDTGRKQQPMKGSRWQSSQPPPKDSWSPISSCPTTSNDPGASIQRCSAARPCWQRLSSPSSRWRTAGSRSASREDQPRTSRPSRSNRPPTPIASRASSRVADIAAVYQEWSARGAEFLTSPIDRGEETRCYMRDPDGHLIEVGQLLARPDRE
jgi:hypothetical protein